MILNKKNIFLLFFSLLFSLNATGIKADFLANNIVNIPQGNLFSSFSKIGINKEAGVSFGFGTLNSTIEQCNFDSYIISSDFYFPIKKVTIKTDFDFLLGTNLLINNSISFDSFSLMIGNIKIAEKITPLYLSAYFSTGTLIASGGQIYIISAVPEIPFLSFALESKSKIGNFFFQYGFFNIKINSESKTPIISSGFQNDFLFLYSNNIQFTNSKLSFWGGILYTMGEASAFTNKKTIKIKADDDFLIIGTGLSFLYQKNLFYVKTNLDFIFLPISKANADIDFRFIFIKESMNYTLDEPLNYSLLIPSFEAGIKIGKKGKLYLSKTLPIPFSPKDSSDLQNSSKNFSFLNILLSGLTIGITL